MRPSFPSVDEVRQLPELAAVVVPSAWLDMNRHVNVRHYVELYDGAGWPLLEMLGIGEKHYETGRTGFFELEHHIYYLAEMRVGERISVHVRFVRRGAKRFHGVMFLVNHTRQLLASTLEFISTAADLELRRSTQIPGDAAARLDALIREHERLAWPVPLCGALAP